jgi:hypothetical protein
MTALLSQPEVMAAVDADGRGLADALCRAITTDGSIPLIRSERHLALLEVAITAGIDLDAADPRGWRALR